MGRAGGAWGAELWNMTNAPMEDVIYGILPYVGLMLVGLIIVLIFPQLALWLPSTMGYGI